MLGPKAYGFPVGERLQGSARHRLLCTLALESAYCFDYYFLPPESMQKGTRAFVVFIILLNFIVTFCAEYDSHKSCLIMLILFIVNPKLKRVPASNLGGESWTMKRRQIAGVRSKKNYTKAV